MALVHDIAPCHIVRVAQLMPKNNNVRVLSWPACSPDLSPFDHVGPPKAPRSTNATQQTLCELGQIVRQAWNDIPQQYFQRYITSMRSCCQATIAANGDHTRY